MIRPSYALKLAQTKLRSKRGMIITSIIIASFPFAALFATAVVLTGAEKSSTEFIKKAGNDRYLVKASPNIPYEELSFTLTPSLDEIRQIKLFEKQYYQELRDRYTALKLEYDVASEIPALEPYSLADKKLPEEQRVKVNYDSPVIRAMEARKLEAYAKTATNTSSDLRTVGALYGAEGYYVVGLPSGLPVTPQLRLVQNGKEDLESSELKTDGDFGNYGYYTNAIHNGMYSFTDQRNLTRYLLTSDTSTLKGIPVVVSAQEAASLFGEKVGIGKEPEAANEKKTWLKDIQAKLNGQLYQACYRNTAEQTMLEKIQRDYIEIKNNEGNKDYRKPSLIYDYPQEICGGITIKEDTRSPVEKQLEAKNEEAQKKLGLYRAPSHRLLTFQIVGVNYTQPFLDYTKGITEYVKSLLVYQDGISTIDIPTQMYDSLPESLKFDDILQEESTRRLASQAIASEKFATRVLEFTNTETARSFLNNETCPMSELNCSKKFKAAPYGSNYLILDEISNLFSRITTIAFPIALGLAAIIIWFTVSRIMAENRREIAVYRAMGAKRNDIAGIYTGYVLLIATQIAFVSVALGIIVAVAVNHFYGAALTDTAATVFGIVNNAPIFSLLSLDSPLLLTVVYSIFIVSMTASMPPLVRNVRRNPIRDMREE